MNIQVSLVASAIRTQDWLRFYNSLSGNTINWEVIFVGNKSPDFELPSNFKFIYSNTKPAQCYEIGFRAASGEIVGWTADDAIYNYKQPNNLDILYNFYQSFNDYRIAVGMRTIEDNRDIWEFHHFFGGKHETPVMLPLGFISKQLMNELGGYDRRFISGQSENDLIMRVYEIGGKAEWCLDSYVYLKHIDSHQCSKNSNMRKWYPQDREILEKAWVKTDGSISSTRLIPFEPFPNETILTITEKPQGAW